MKRTDAYYGVDIQGITRNEVRAKNWQKAYNFAKSLAATLDAGMSVNVRHQTYDGYIFRGLATWKSLGNGQIERVR